MHCHQFEERLQLLLDQRRQPESDGELRQHAERCGECREQLVAQQLLFSGLRKQASLPADFAISVVDQVAGVKGKPVATANAVLWTWAAVVATATAAACLLWFSPAWNAKPEGNANTAQHSPERSKPETLAITQPPSATRPPARPKTSPPSASVEGDHGPSPYEEQFRQWVHTLPTAVDHIEEVDYLLVEEYAPGLRSLRASFALAIETLRRSLPGHREGLKTEGAQVGPLLFPPA